MNSTELKALLVDCCNDISFVLGGKSCGITPEVTNYKPVYHVWCGTNTKDFYDAQDVLTAPFFGGRSLEELCEGLEFEIS